MTSYTDADGALPLSLLTRAAEQFVAERDWQQFHDPKNLAMALASEVGELTAILRWVSNDDSDAFVGVAEHRSRIEAEIGDVGICLLLLCARANIDLGTAITSKLRANAAKYPAETSRGRADPPTPVERGNA